MEDVWEKLEKLRPTLETLDSLLNDKNLKETPVVLEYGLEVAAGDDNPVIFLDADDTHFFGKVKEGRIFTWEKFDTARRWRVYQPKEIKAGGK